MHLDKDMAVEVSALFGSCTMRDFGHLAVKLLLNFKFIPGV